MKYKIFAALLFFPITILSASDLVEYERHYEDLNRLKNTLEKLELQKKINEVQMQIDKDAFANSPQPILPEGEFGNEVFSPKDLTLLYLIGSGKSTKAFVQHKDKTLSFANGQSYQGWLVKIDGKSVTFSKGGSSVTL
ncbi:MAG: hypothetical protein ACRC24_09350 [Vibrionaceae bacterium]